MLILVMCLPRSTFEKGFTCCMEPAWSRRWLRRVQSLLKYAWTPQYGSMLHEGFGVKRKEAAMLYAMHDPEQTPLIIPMEDPLLHTAEHPFCYNDPCLCHEDPELI